MTPTRPLRVRATAARAPGSITPTIGSAKRSSSARSATADAVLHATTRSLMPRATRKSTFSMLYRVTVSADFVPYG
jgi:hypothetical protein